MYISFKKNPWVMTCKLALLLKWIHSTTNTKNSVNSTLQDCVNF